MSGRAFKYGDNINTDVMYPGRYLEIKDMTEMGKHALEDLDKDFVKKVKPGDVIVAGKNLGCGSSREQAAKCLVAVGVKAVIAKSMARIFYRNAINLGMAVVVSPEVVDGIDDGDEVEVDLAGGVVKNLTKKTELKFEPLPPFIMEIIRDGGLIPHLKKKLGAKK
ncbi:MAG: 3-isopropylmalate dehydratase small subunit [Thermoplasmata archaeon]